MTKQKIKIIKFKTGRITIQTTHGNIYLRHGSKSLSRNKMFKYLHVQIQSRGGIFTKVMHPLSIELEVA